MTPKPYPHSLLLVEDSEDDAFFFRRTFEKSGITCRLHHARNGAEAVAFLEAALKSGIFPAAVFLDLKMPVMNGFEVLAWMRTKSFPADLQVVVLSGSEHQEDVIRARELGAADYLVKPIGAETLYRYLGQVCPRDAAVVTGALH